MKTGITKKMPKRSFHPGITTSAIRVTGITWLAMLLCLLAHSPAMAVNPMVAAGGNHTVGLRADGSVVAVGSNTHGQTNVSTWTDIIQVAAGGLHTVGLRADGTVVAVGNNIDGQTDVSTWTDIVQVAAGGNHTVGLRVNGTVMAVGNNIDGQTDVSAWTDIVQVAAALYSTIGLHADGTVVAVGKNVDGHINVNGWSNIVQVAAGLSHTVGLRADGTVVGVGNSVDGQTDVGAWSNIIHVAVGAYHTVGLRADGSVIAAGSNRLSQTSVGNWKDIVQVVAGGDHTIGLNADGTVVAVGRNVYGQTNVIGWTNMVQVEAGGDYSIGLRTDGTVVAVGYNDFGRTNVSAWTEIVQVEPGGTHTVGLRADGTVVAVGDNRYGQTNVGSWTDIIQVTAGGYHTVGLRADGSVIAVGSNNHYQANVSAWSDIVQVAAFGLYTVGLRADGTVVAVGDNRYGQTNVGSWTDIIQVTTGGYHTVGLRADGTVVAAGLNNYGQTNVSAWTGIIQVSAGAYHTIGLSLNSEIIGAGSNDISQLNMFNWLLFATDHDYDGDGFTIAQGDCNEFSREIHPGAAEICDHVDNNCNGSVDEGFTDNDSDGFAACAGDCNDADPAIHPNASEICDSIDNNCNGSVDEGFDNDNDGYTICLGDCNDTDPAVYPIAVEICSDGKDNNCNGLTDSMDLACALPPIACTYDAQCRTGEFCKKAIGSCDGIGECMLLPNSGSICSEPAETVCGCDGRTYDSGCLTEKAGINVAANGQCAASGYKWKHYFPAITDNSGIGWENYLTVQAKDPVAMDVTIRVYSMGGTLMGTYMYSNTNPAAQAPAIAPNARVAARPSMIAGTQTNPIPVEGSMIVETSVPAIATTNTIANFFEGFSIYEAAKPKTSHRFPKTYDGPNNYQVSLLAQNIYDKPVNLTVKLFGKTATSPGHGAIKTVDLPAYATLKVRPSDVAGGINFDGSVMITSDLAVPEDGLGLSIPAMCRYELGKEAMSIYESTARLPILSFPVLKDGKFGGTMDYQNYLSVVNPTGIDVTVEVVLYSNAGVKKATTGPVVIPGNGKSTWRPSMILGSVTSPIDFEGSAVVLSTIQVVGQTNTIYPGANQYNTDAFDLFESAMPSPSLFFPKLFDNIVATGHLYDNFVYVQNPEGTVKNIKIEQFNNNGSANGTLIMPLGPYATHVYRPKDLVTDGTGQFRGSVRVTETGGGKITGAIKYDLHQGTTSTTPVDAMTLYRSMGQ